MGLGKDNEEVYLKDIWPTPESVNALLDKIESDLYINRYQKIGEENSNWDKIQALESPTYNWNVSSTYIQNPPFLSDNKLTENNLKSIKSARILALLGDSITTDHISAIN